MLNNRYQLCCYFALMMITGAISISKALMVNHTLLALRMEWNNIGDDGIAAIAGSLSNSSITILDVVGCCISVVGVSLLAGALSSNQKIGTLWLERNPITADGARLILKTAVENAVCKDVRTDKYHDDEVRRMKGILYDRRRQDVRML